MSPEDLDDLKKEIIRTEKILVEIFSRHLGKGIEPTPELLKEQKDLVLEIFDGSMPRIDISDPETYPRLADISRTAVMAGVFSNEHGHMYKLFDKTYTEHTLANIVGLAHGATVQLKQNLACLGLETNDLIERNPHLNFRNALLHFRYDVEAFYKKLEECIEKLKTTRGYKDQYCSD